jgi:hypothetical protein
MDKNMSNFVEKAANGAPAKSMPQVRFLGDTKSSLGDAKSSLGDS